MAASQLRQILRYRDDSGGREALAMREFANVWNELWFRQRSAEMMVALALSPALSWIGPFDLVEESFLARMGFWSGVLASWFMLVALTDLLLARSRTIAALGNVWRRAVTLALAAVPMIGVAGFAIETLHGWKPSVAEITELYFQIVLLGSAMIPLSDVLIAPLMRSPRVAGRPLIEPNGDRVHPPEALPALACPLLAQLPPENRGRLVCLEMQDHYVRVHTTQGSALVLMRLRDAIANTQPVPGRQVHRSWWVADGAVERFERAGRTGIVRLSGGRRVPVSQRYLQDVSDTFASPARPTIAREVGL